MTAQHGKDWTMTVVGLLVGVLVSGAAFILIGIGKVDRNELHEELAKVRMEAAQQDAALKESVAEAKLNLDASRERFEELEATVIRNTARIDFLISQATGTPPGRTSPIP